METIDYKELIHVIDSIVVYEKDGLELCVEYVNDKYLYIEVEENEQYNMIEKMIEALEKININYIFLLKKLRVINK